MATWTSRRLPVVDNITEDSGYMEAKEKAKKAEYFVAPGSAHSFSMPGRRLSPWIFFMVGLAPMSMGRTEDEMCEAPKSNETLGASSTSWIILGLGFRVYPIALSNHDNERTLQ